MSLEYTPSGTTGTFANWIAGYFPGETDPNIIGFGADPDGDGKSNGIEAWFGTHPGEFDGASLTGLSTDGTNTTFTHPRNENPLYYLSGFYEWSLNLVDWYAGDGVDGPPGGPNVTLSPLPAGATVTVIATANEALERLYLRAGVMQN